MKVLRLVLLAVVCLVFLASCGNQKAKQDQVPEMLNVDLSISPEKGEVNQPVTFKAKVTQGKEAVNDADEVTFEIWRSKDPNHEKVQIKKANKGIYSLTKSFKQEGTYYIFSHVTARGMHNMPKKEFVIGQPSEKEDSKTNSSMEGMK